jgi:sigma-54 dependent transcriptional regulator, flagellar regulatory protein
MGCERSAAHPKLPVIIGVSPSIRHIYNLISKVSNSDSTVLLLGESGTGKELVAKTIHYSSRRAERPFVPVNCGAIPAELLESELFGHEKGAFTGAIAPRTGRFELADGGTIFLDEIGEMPAILQVKLLRVLQERSFERIGGVKTVDVDVRVISATNQNLEEAVKSGRFREDLYYRINVIPVEMPPLRSRTEDLPLLCEFFMAKHSGRLNKRPLTISAGAMQIFKAYEWPGNVRELENMIERLLVLKDDDIITPGDLSEKMTGKCEPKMSGADVSSEDPDVNPFVQGIDLNQALIDYEKKILLHALNLHEGVKSQAAKYLNINRTTLIEKMKRLGLQNYPA